MALNQFMKEWAEEDSWPRLSAYGEFKKYYRKNKVLIGFKGKTSGLLDELTIGKNGMPVVDYDSPVYMDMHLDSDNPPAIFIFGRKGCGKSTLVSQIGLNSLSHGMGCACFGIDPQARMGSHRNPQTDPKILETLNRIKSSPQGMNITTITPAWLKNTRKYANSDLYYKLGKRDFDEIGDPSFQSLLIQEILGLGKLMGAERQLQKIVEYNPTSIEEMLKMARMLSRDKKLKKKWGKTQVLEAQLNSRLKQGVLGDDGYLNIVELMKESIVLLQCSLARSEHINSVYVAFALNQVKEGLEGRKFGKRKTVIMIDEMDVLAPAGNENPPSKMFVEFALTKWRGDGVLPIGIAQNPNTVSEIALSQIDYYLCPKIDYDSNEEKFLKRRNININEFNRLFYGKTYMYPKQWGMVDSDGEVQFFFPPPPISSTI